MTINTGHSHSDNENIPNNVSLTFIGHATWLIEGNGKRVITDPVLSPRIGGIYPRITPPGLSAQQIPPVDAVLISHPHLDHMDVPTLKRLNRDTLLAVPQGTVEMAKTLSYRETAALRNWEIIELSSDLKITAVPAVHVGIRGWGWGASARGAIGYVIEIAGHRIYFAGDTAYGPHFTEIKKRFNPDIALLPIGAYRPWFIMGHFHMSPKLALQAFIDLEAKWALPYHYGTFILSLESVREPLRLFKREAMRRDLMEKILVAKHGQAISL